MVILFYLVAVLAILSAITVVLHRNPVYSVLALVVTLFQIAVLFLLLDAYLVAFLQVIVYAGAIVVLFLFVIMLLSLEPEVPLEKGSAVRAMAVLLAVMMGVELGAVSFVNRPAVEIPAPEGFGSAEVLARHLFSSHLLAFELTSVLLLVAVVGAVVMARRKA